MEMWDSKAGLPYNIFKNLFTMFSHIFGFLICLFACIASMYVSESTPCCCTCKRAKQLINLGETTFE